MRLTRKTRLCLVQEIWQPKLPSSGRQESIPPEINLPRYSDNGTGSNPRRINIKAKR